MCSIRKTAYKMNELDQYWYVHCSEWGYTILVSTRATLQESTSRWKQHNILFACKKIALFSQIWWTPRFIKDEMHQTFVARGLVEVQPTLESVPVSNIRQIITGPKPAPRIEFLSESKFETEPHTEKVLWHGNCSTFEQFTFDISRSISPLENVAD